mmetsp:Transcript_11482/g.13100  ORF Transcript_11482/g.13100 Transcript_11482/m.13100 type:complete len:609 (+) Transcript_11482:114-1940(+)
MDNNRNHGMEQIMKLDLEDATDNVNESDDNYTDHHSLSISDANIKLVGKERKSSGSMYTNIRRNRGMQIEDHDELTTGLKEFTSSVDTEVPYEHQAQERIRQRRECQKRTLRFLCVIGVVVTISISLMIMFTGDAMNRFEYVYPHDYHTNNETRLITHTLTTVSNLDILFDPSTPQYEALEWILYQDPMRKELIKNVVGNYIDHIIVTRYVLAVFFIATEGRGWRSNEGWLSGLHACYWHGVTCVSDEPVMLQLGNNNLIGTIPEEINRSEALGLINLSDNFLRGTIPPSFGHLLELDLANNLLEGTIPAQFWGDEGFIRRISLRNNLLTGTIPSHIGGLMQLTRLDLSANRLSGKIPSLSRMRSLITLNLGFNKLSGSIPSDIGSSSKLIEVALFQNLLTGRIPPSINLLANLRLLDMHENTISGHLPDDFGLNHTGLKLLDLHKNDISGIIPENLGSLESLTSIDLSWNKFKGTIPSQLSFLNLLQFLRLDGNKLTGSIPLTTEMEYMSKLNVLSLRSNQLTGSIHSSIGKLTLLTSLLLDDNYISGKIPVEIKNMLRLEMILLEDTSLAGSVPEPICSLKSEQKLKSIFVDCEEVSCSCCTNCPV